MDVKRLVTTVFKSNAAQLVGDLKTIGHASVEATKGLASVASGGLGALQAAADKVNFREMLGHVAEIGSKFEDWQIQIAGFITASGAVTDFNKSMLVSESMMAKIVATSAKLPGEAEEYIEVFKMGMVPVRNAMHGSLNDTMTFTNKWAAFTKTLGEASRNAGMDLMRLLASEKGGANVRMKSWEAIQNVLKGMPEYASMTAKEFNQMIPEKRIEILKKAVAKFDPMINKMAGTWTAMLGAFYSNTKAIARGMTENIFNSMKKGLGTINDLFMDADGNFTKLSKWIMAAGQAITSFLVTPFEGLLDVVSKIPDQIGAAGAAIRANPALHMIGRAVGRVGGAVGGAVGRLTAPGGVVSSIQSAAGPMMTVFGQRLSILSKLIDPLLTMLTTVANIAASTIIPVFVEVQGVLNSVLRPVVKLLSGIFVDVTNVFKALQPKLQEFFAAAKRLVHAIGGVLQPIIRIVAHMLQERFHRALMIAQKAISAVVTVLKWWWNVLSSILEKLGQVAGKVADMVAGPEEPEEAAEEDQADWFQKLIDAFDKAGEDQDKKSDELKKAMEESGAAGAIPKSQVTQDFRGSRFDISQKFAEGFDPDRIAVAFAQDVGKVGTKRLQSAFEPAFGVR